MKWLLGSSHTASLLVQNLMCDRVTICNNKQPLLQYLGNGDLNSKIQQIKVICLFEITKRL